MNYKNKHTTRFIPLSIVFIIGMEIDIFGVVQMLPVVWGLVLVHHSDSS